MVKRNRYIIPILIFSLLQLGFGISFGLEAAETVQLRFRVFPVNTGNWEGIKVQVEPNVVQPLKFRKNRRSAALEYRSANPIIFFREVLHPSVEGSPSIERVPVAQIQVPNGLHEALFFFAALPEKDRKGGREYLIYAMDDSLAAFPVDSMVICNLTGTELIGKIGETAATFQVGASRAYDFGRYKKGLPVLFAVETKTGLRPVFMNRLKYSENKRVILLFEPPQKAGSLRVVAKRIVQFVPEIKKEK